MKNFQAPVSTNAATQINQLKDLLGLSNTEILELLLTRFADENDRYNKAYKRAENKLFELIEQGQKVTKHILKKESKANYDTGVKPCFEDYEKQIDAHNAKVEAAEKEAKNKLA